MQLFRRHCCRQIPEEDSEESAHEEMWHENVQKDSPPPAKYTNVPIAVHRPAVHRDDVPRSTKVPPVRQNITKNPRGTASEAQLQRLVDEIAKLKEEILRRQVSESFTCYCLLTRFVTHSILKDACFVAT